MFKRFFNWLINLFKKNKTTQTQEIGNVLQNKEEQEEHNTEIEQQTETEQQTIVQNDVIINDDNLNVENVIDEEIDKEVPDLSITPTVDKDSETIPTSIVIEQPKEPVQTYGGPSKGKYFTISELCASDTARERGIKNVPNETESKHLYELIINLLDLIREDWGKKCSANGWGSGGIKITSGFRCEKLNKIVGGVSNSAHLFGYAADTQPVNKRQTDYEKFIQEWVQKHPSVAFDQIIVERSKYSRWVHVAIKDGKGRQRKQCFNLKV